MAIKVTRSQLRRLVESTLEEARSPLAFYPSDDDVEHATSAEYGLDMLHAFFNTPELKAAKTLVMVTLQHIRNPGVEDQGEM